MEVEWKINGIFKANAQKVYEEIGCRKVTPEDVLEQARNNENSELHKCFEWNDSIAAEKYRLTQARQIIQLLVIKPEKKEEPQVRVFQITTETNNYQPVRLFLEQPDEYKALLQRAKNELSAFKTRYKTLSELETVFNEIDKVI